MSHQPEPTVPLDHQSRRARTWTWLSIAAFAVFSILGLLLVSWGINHDLSQIHQTLLQSEVGRIRSHAIRTVANIQDELHKNSSQDLGVLQQTDYPRRNWERTFKDDDSRPFAAVVDQKNTVKLHYDKSLEGKQLPQDWDEQTFLDDAALADVVLTDTPSLTGGVLAYDIQVPIIVQDQTIGTYHAGLNSAWLEDLYNEKKSAALSFWIWLLIAMLMFEIAAAAALYYTSRRVAILHEASKVARSRRYAEIGQLMAGIVHEIRNPLNAMRLNLHVLERSEKMPRELLTEELSLDREMMIHETQGQIDCVESLLRILQSYTRADIARPELLDMRNEVQATLNFVRPLLEHREMAVVARMPEQSLGILMDRDRFRQVLLNLLNNACEAMQPGGTIELSLRQDQLSAVLVVSDQGEGIPSAIQERIFEPFYSTKNTGTGLGLAIVRRHIEDAGGEVRCAARANGGAEFTVRLPLQQTKAAPAALPQQTTSE
jgi:two-component system sensor histidine kinase HydH